MGVDSTTVIEGRGVWLRPPQTGDYAQWAELRALSRDHLVPWEPQWPRDELTRFAYRRRVRHYQSEAADDLGYAFFILSAYDDRLLGGLSLSHVRRGVIQAASLGYWLGLPFVGRGIMTEAVRAAVGHAFDVLKLHRLEAATQPNNTRSIRVLEVNGFEREGFAKGYLKINGVWADHLLFGRLAGHSEATEVRCS
jgi:ribosomal-protein-alanine N-acetyltransferase